MKQYYYEGKKYCSLPDALDKIGLLYGEWFHNQDIFGTLLQPIFMIGRRSFVDAKRVNYIATRTRGYVPLQYAKKRAPIHPMSKTAINKRPLRVYVFGTIWTQEYPHSEKSLDSNLDSVKVES